jgi:Flp pilus assembly pilin Flp
MIKRFLAFSSGLLRRTEGASIVEYSVLLLLIAILAVALVGGLGSWINALYNSFTFTI